MTRVCLGTPASTFDKDRQVASQDDGGLGSNPWKELRHALEKRPALVGPVQLDRPRPGHTNAPADQSGPRPDGNGIAGGAELRARNVRLGSWFRRRATHGQPQL